MRRETRFQMAMSPCVMSAKDQIVVSGLTEPAMNEKRRTPTGGRPCLQEVFNQINGIQWTTRSPSPTFPGSVCSESRRA